jgi:hypothetical protein
MSPTNFWSKLIHNLYVPWKKVAKDVVLLLYEIIKSLPKEKNRPMGEN